MMIVELPELQARVIEPAHSPSADARIAHRHWRYLVLHWNSLDNSFHRSFILNY